MNKEFKISAFLYMPLMTTDLEIESIICNYFNSVDIESIEHRENEIATSFNVIFESNSVTSAKDYFLKAFNGYDVDNYTIEEN